MNLLALLFALLCERGLTAVLRLREARWLDRYGDWTSRVVARRAGAARWVLAAIAIAVPVLPVAVVSHSIGSHLLGLPQLLFAVLVLLFSFGPRDLKDEVDDYVGAIERGDLEAAAQRGKELRESNAAGRGPGVRDGVEEAIFVQANNRIFGVIFWFLLLGATGAWLFRVSDLLRRRAAFEATRAEGAPPQDASLRVLADLHGILAWAPARLGALSYALTGSFEDAVGNWKAAVDGAGANLLERAEDLLARVGRGSLMPSLANVAPADLDLATARGAWRIVLRALWIWIVTIAVLVLAGRAA
jgi:AmpE protein